MSLYVTVSGDLMVPDEKAFLRLIQALQEGGWMDEELHLTYETDERVADGPHANRERQQIVIPPFHARNLSRVGFFEHPDTYGCLRFSTTDGMQAVWLEGPSNYCTPELPLSLFSEFDEPVREDFGEGEDAVHEYMDALAEWANEAEAEFHAACASDILGEAQRYLMQDQTSCLANIDGLLLHQQKLALYRLIRQDDCDPTARDLVEGLLNMLDAMEFTRHQTENAPS